ncbi:MAG: MFS transporter [Desulfomonilaceae bacterium]|nr:MFS transporter [Desulfomonilaceae bacterium]
MNPSERRILLVTCFGHLMSHYNMLVFPALILPLSVKLQLPMSEVLGLSFPMYLLFGLMALPWGMIGDKWGAKPLMLLQFLGSGIFGLAAAIYIDSPSRLAWALAGVGLFSAIYHPIGLGMISKGVERVSLAMGYNAVFGGLGLVVAPLVTGLTVWISGPTAAFLILAGLNLVGVAFMVLLPIERTSARQTRRREEDNGMVGAFLILLVAMMLGGIAYRGATVILPAYLELNGKGIFEALSGLSGGALSSNLVATSLTAMIYAVGMVGQYVGGHVGERFERRYAYLLFHAICIPAVLLMSVAHNLPLVALGFVYLFFLLGMQPIENTLVATFAPRRLHHSAYGMKFILTFGVGALAVKMIQRIEAAWSIEAAFVSLGIISVILVGAIVVLIAWTNRAAVQSGPHIGPVLTDK